MRAVDVGVGHDDDLVVAQVVRAILRARTDAERLDEIGELLVLRQLVARRRGDVEDLAAQRQHRLGRAVARLLGRTAGRVALDDKEFRALRRGVRAVGELARQPQLARRRLAGDVLLHPPPHPLFGALEGEVEQLGRLARARRRANGRKRRAPSRRRCRAASAVCSRPLFWPWNSGSRINTEISAAQPLITSSVVIPRRAWPGRCARRGP